jgi:hypothetical protein
MQHHHDCVGQLGTYEGSGMFDRVTVEEPTMAKCNWLLPVYRVVGQSVDWYVLLTGMQPNIRMKKIMTGEAIG